MISTMSMTLTARPYADANRAWVERAQSSLKTGAASARDTESRAVQLPKPKTARALLKELAARKLQDLVERTRQLKLLIKVDKKLGLQAATQIAKELKDVVKAYRDAMGDRGVGSPLSLYDAEARQADAYARRAEEAARTEAAQAEAEAQVQTEDAGREAQAFETTADETATAEANALPDDDSEAGEDRSFAQQVKMVITGLKDARDKVREGAMDGGRMPNEDDWKAFSKALGDLERAWNLMSGDFEPPLLSMKV